MIRSKRVNLHPLIFLFSFTPLACPVVLVQRKHLQYRLILVCEVYDLRRIILRVHVLSHLDLTELRSYLEVTIDISIFH